MVALHSKIPFRGKRGLAERYNGIVEVRGSTPLGSTKDFPKSLEKLAPT